MRVRDKILGRFKSSASSSFPRTRSETGWYYDLPEWLHCAVAKLELTLDLNLPNEKPRTPSSFRNYDLLR